MQDYRKTKLYKAIDEVLHYLWDPIGISIVPQARDEYYIYSARVYKMITENADEKSIANYLYEVQKERMGLESKVEDCQLIVDIIIDWKTYLETKD